MASSAGLQPSASAASVSELTSGPDHFGWIYLDTVPDFVQDLLHFLHKSVKGGNSLLEILLFLSLYCKNIIEKCCFIASCCQCLALHTFKANKTN